MDFAPGAELTFLFNTPKVVGQLLSIVIWWEAKYSILTPSDWVRKHYLYVDGNVEVTSAGGSVVQLRLATSRIEEKKPVTASVVSAKIGGQTLFRNWAGTAHQSDREFVDILINWQATLPNQRLTVPWPDFQGRG